jgi:protein transport protein SEC31
MVPRNFNWDLGRERLIKQNLLIGNYGGAIDAALKCGRTAEALIIAYSQGQDVFKSTLKSFFTETTDNFITNILKHIADKESDELIKKYQLANWKECIAFIYSLVRDQRGHLLKLLAGRLLQEQNSVEKALVCLTLAEDFNEVLVLLGKQLAELQPRSVQRKQVLLKVVEKLLVVKSVITKEVQPSQQLDRIVLEASVLCFDEG